MKYLYETHMHTSQGSACGHSEGHEYVEIYKKLGYTGIFVTDHFFQGNCAMNRTLPWRERVDAYMAGYRDAKAVGDQIGLDVFFGIEQNYNGDEYLIYGVDENFLYAHPEIETWTRPELYEAVHAAGGCVVQAHPFRERGYLTRIHLNPFCVDGIEGVNTANQPEQDALAVRYGQALHMPMTCGNDIHDVNRIDPSTIGATATNRRIESAKDFAAYILSGEPLSMVVPNGRDEWMESAEIHLPVDIHDAKNKAENIPSQKMSDILSAIGRLK